MVAILTNVAGRLEALAGVQSSAGAADAEKVPVLDPNGIMPLSMDPAAYCEFFAAFNQSSGYSYSVPSGTLANLPFSNAERNTGSAFNASNYTFTAPLTATYEFAVSLRLDAAVGAGQGLTLNLQRNGSQAALVASAGSGISTMGGLGRLSLNAGDNITLATYVNFSGATVSFSGGSTPASRTYFRGWLAGPV